MDGVEIDYRENEEIKFLKRQLNMKDVQIDFLQEVIKNLWREKNNES